MISNVAKTLRSVSASAPSRGRAKSTLLPITTPADCEREANLRFGRADSCKHTAIEGKVHSASDVGEGSAEK